MPKEKRKQMKHLQIGAYETPLGTVVRILDQSHRGNQFSPDGTAVFKHVNVSIQSACCPSFSCADCGHPHVLHVQGSDASRDNDAVLIPNKLMPAIKEAVQAYNDACVGEPEDVLDRDELEAMGAEIIE